MATNSKESQLELRIYAGENPILNFYSSYYNASIKDRSASNIHFIRTMKTRLLANIKPAALKVPIEKFQPTELNHLTTQKSYITLKIQLQTWTMPYNNTYVVMSWISKLNPNAYDYISILCKKKEELGYKSCYYKWLNMCQSDTIVTDLIYDKKWTFYIVYYTYSCNKANACGFIIKNFRLLDIGSPDILSPEDDGYGFVRRPHPLIPPVKVNMANSKKQYNVSKYHHNPYMTASGLYTFNFGIDNSLTYDLKWYHGKKSLMWDYVAIYRHYPKNVSDYINGQWCWVANFNNSCNTAVEFERDENYYIAYITYDYEKARYLISETSKYHNFTAWMGKYRQFLKYLRITDVIMPGTYCSSCYNMSAPMFTPWSQTQTENIANQLRDGIRYFDLRTKYLSWLQTKFWFSHNKYLSNISLASFLTTIKTFTFKYVNEIIILHFVDFDDFTKDGIHDDLLDIVFEQLRDYLVPNTYIGKMLGSFWKDDKRIIVVYDQKSRSSKYQSNDLVWDTIHSIKPNFEGENKISFQAGDFNRINNRSLSVVQFVRLQQLDGQIPVSVQTLSNGINPQIDYWFTKRNRVPVNIITSNYYLGNNMINLAIKRNIEMGKQVNLYSNHDNATKLAI